VKELALTRYCLGVAGAVGFLLCWEVVGRTGLVDSRIFPPPAAVAIGLLDRIRDGTIAVDAGATIARVGIGYIIGSFLGISAGIITSVFRTPRSIAEPTLNFLRPVPAVSLVPLAVVWFGVDDTQRIFVISWAAFFPIWINTHSGIQAIPQELLDAGRVLGSQRGSMIFRVIVPASMPAIFAGARVSLAFAFSASVVAEMAGATSGLGYRVMFYHSVFRPELMIGAIGAIGSLGFLFDRLFLSLWRYACPWMPMDGLRI
jgi:ABC-type nitrate/sulfonate/bicarbonate transport system permease component